MKAIIGALIAGLGALSTAVEDEQVTGREWVLIALTFVVALGAVYATPNRPRPPKV